MIAAALIIVLLYALCALDIGPVVGCWLRARVGDAS